MRTILLLLLNPTAPGTLYCINCFVTLFPDKAVFAVTLLVILKAPIGRLGDAFAAGGALAGIGVAYHSFPFAFIFTIMALYFGEAMFNLFQRSISSLDLARIFLPRNK
jgi:hypothetical protein